MKTNDDAVAAPGILVRVTPDNRARVRLSIDGRQTEALVGDTVLTALLTQGTTLRHSEFSGEARAGFCMMGACQDCWVTDSDGHRFRSCSTPVSEGMSLVTTSSEETP